MKKFEDAFNKIMNSRIFYETVLRKSIVYEAQNKNFYDRLVKFEDDGKSYDIIFDEYDLVEESHEDAELKKNLYNLIEHVGNGEQISLSKVFSFISNKLKSKYKLKIENDVPIYIFKFNFSDPQTVYSMFKSFGIYCESDRNINISLKEKIEYENEKFKENVGDSQGLYFNAGNAKLIILNVNPKNHYNENVVNHEIYHLIQDVFGIHINLDDISPNEIPELQLSGDDLKYLYKKDEFETHIKVDLINQLEEIYWKYFKDESRSMFIGKFILETRSNPIDIYENEVVKKIISKNVKHNDLTALRLFYSTFLIKDKSWNKSAVTWLRNTF